jgi:cell wall assembly regulator SMI1
MEIRQSTENRWVTQSWGELKRILGDLDPGTPDNLYPGVDDTAIDRLQAKLAVPLPVELETLYRMNDGEGRVYEAFEHQLVETFTLPFFTVPEPAADTPCGYSFMKMHGHDSVSEELASFAEIGGFSSEQRYPPIAGLDWMERAGPVRRVPASPGWIPFAKDFFGNFLCVDVDPDEGGVVGQVIEVAYDASRLRVVASSLADYLDTMVARASAVSAGLGEAITAASRLLPRE